jgi:hypothetical protein
MAESLVHLQLVARIVSHIRDEYQAYQLAVFHDLPNLIGAEKPPRIGGFVPDVFAIDAPPSITILGEAKTVEDLETEHSLKQLTAFLAFLRLQPSGILVVAVPWQAQARAKNLVARLQQELQCKDVRAIVITELTG